MQWTGKSELGSEGRSEMRWEFRSAEIEDSEMKFYISATGIKKVTISNSGSVEGGEVFAGGMKAKGSPRIGRRISHKAVMFPAILTLLLFSFLFVRIAFLFLESAAICSTSLGNFLSLFFFFSFFFTLNLFYFIYFFDGASLKFRMRNTQ